MPEKKTSHVTFDGRTVVDTNTLVRNPKVQDRLNKLSEATKRYGSLMILRRVKAGA